MPAVEKHLGGEDQDPSLTNLDNFGIGMVDPGPIDADPDAMWRVMAVPIRFGHDRRLAAPTRSRRRVRRDSSKARWRAAHAAHGQDPTERRTTDDLGCAPYVHVVPARPQQDRIDAGGHNFPCGSVTVCKTAGSAYVGSNPTPATTPASSRIPLRPRHWQREQ